MQKMRANIFTKRFDLQVYKKLIFMMKIMLRCKIKAGGTIEKCNLLGIIFAVKLSLWVI